MLPSVATERCICSKRNNMLRHIKHHIFLVRFRFNGFKQMFQSNVDDEPTMKNVNVERVTMNDVTNSPTNANNQLSPVLL